MNVRLRNNRRTRNKAIGEALSSFAKTISYTITYPYRRLTRSRTYVHPIKDSPGTSPKTSPKTSSKASLKTSPRNQTKKISPTKKHQPYKPPPSTYFASKIEEEADNDDIKLEFGSGKKQKTNKTRNSRKK